MDKLVTVFDSMGPSGVEAAAEWRRNMKGDTGKFWQHVSMFHPAKKAKAKGTDAHLHDGNIPAHLTKATIPLPQQLQPEYDRYMASSDDADFNGDLVAYWTNHRDYSRRFKEYVVLLIAETASTESIERVFSTLSWVDSELATRIKPETTMRKCKLAFNRDMTLSGIYRSQRIQRKREALHEEPPPEQPNPEVLVSGENF